MMVKSKHTHNLFNASGCLTLETINRFHSGKLSNKELEEVREHMEGCEICRDAVDGYKNLPDRKRQQDLILTLQKKMKSRYSHAFVRVKYRRERRLKPTITYISAAATILIILGIFGILNTDLFHNNNYIAEQIQEEEIKSEDRITSMKESTHQTQSLEPPEAGQQPEAEDPSSEPEPEFPGDADEITGDMEMAEESLLHLDNTTSHESKEMVSPELMDTPLFEKERHVAGVAAETVSLEAAGEARKAAALPVKDKLTSRDAEKRMKIEDTVPASTKAHFFSTVDQMPQFSVTGYRDFHDYIRKNVKHPYSEKERGVTGELLIRFIVNKNGDVEDVEAIQSLDSLLDQEVIRVVKSSPKWIPGKENGEKVNVQLVYPVIFE